MKFDSQIPSLLEQSRFLAAYLRTRPKVLKETTASPWLRMPKDEKRMRLELGGRFERDFDGTLSSAQTILRDYKYREITRIAVRDLGNLAPFEEIGRELSSLAAASIEWASRAAFRILGGKEKQIPPFAVLGLGKLGGDDLNFSSDIDILYVYRPAGAEDSPREEHGFFTRASEQITRILNEPTPDGFAFRVDLGLRPEGQNGPLVNPINALRDYYEISGAPWERAALTKARPVGGDPAVGGEVLREIEPFVYRKTLDMSAAADLKKMKEKINAELAKSGRGGFHVKLGRGGIREIEFFATAFQLIYGGKETRLRERNTLRLLDVIALLGLVPGEEITRLKEAYIFLRRIENRLQMAEERQVHTLPTAREEQTVLSRQMGFEETDRFLETLQEKTAFVASCFERLAS